MQSAAFPLIWLDDLIKLHLCYNNDIEIHWLDVFFYLWCPCLFLLTQVNLLTNFHSFPPSFSHQRHFMWILLLLFWFSSNAVFHLWPFIYCYLQFLLFFRRSRSFPQALNAAHALLKAPQSRRTRCRKRTCWMWLKRFHGMWAAPGEAPCSQHGRPAGSQFVIWSETRCWRRQKRKTFHLFWFLFNFDVKLLILWPASLLLISFGLFW